MLCTEAAWGPCGPQWQILYTDLMTGPKKKIIGQCEDMYICDNYLKGDTDTIE